MDGPWRLGQRPHVVANGLSLMRAAICIYVAASTALLRAEKNRLPSVLQAASTPASAGGCPDGKTKITGPP